MGFLGIDVDTGSQGSPCLIMHEHVVISLSSATQNYCFCASRNRSTDFPPDRVLYSMTFMIVFVPKLTKSSSRVPGIVLRSTPRISRPRPR